MALDATIEQINKQTITANGEPKQKYGFKVKEWDKDEWVNAVDWDEIYDDKKLSKGDTVKITEPEHDPQYGWQADFVDPTKNDNGTQGYSDVEQILANQEHIIIPALKMLSEELIENDTPEDDIEYEEPSEEQKKHAEDDSINPKELNDLDF